MLSFFPWGVLDEILNLIESVSTDFSSYSSNITITGGISTFITATTAVPTNQLSR